MTDDRTPGYDEPDFDRLDTSPISLAEWGLPRDVLGQAGLREWI